MPPLHPQTPLDREYLTSLFPLFRNFPPDFQFPLETDPNYVPGRNSLYCLITGSIVCSLTTVVACLRFWVRAKSSFGMDDWVMLPAFVCYCVFNCVNIVGLSDTGIGYHIYDLSTKDIHNYLIVQYLHTVFWTLALHLTRCSILHLLLRLAPAQSLIKRRFLQGVLFCSYAFLFANLVVLIFECRPVSAAFDLRSRLDGTCVGSTSVDIYAGLCAGHIALDLLTIFPPILVIYKLPMTRAKKFNLYFILALGVITIIFTSVRMFLFYSIMVKSFDLTRNATAVGFWSIMESSLAVTIACLPALNRSIVTFCRCFHGRRSEQGSTQRIRNKHGIIKFDGKIYKGHAKYISYSAAATAQGGTVRSYVEIPDTRTESDERLDNTTVFDGKGPDSYPDITVERTFQVIEERASVIDHQLEAQRAGSSLAHPMKARFFSGYRRSSPSDLDENEMVIIKK
ncbi:hypothetical protein TWF225_004261 [Orbilia oligospora]|nr:hypothetical protein TWF225_004261 [Orbilia oligospora]KAF3245113.1 hypothetical protein TWF128_009509 [Orbilia oligospora]KAF3272855.1 hypothetical protein TWF217_000315 [Orbilia oligospora]KAF3277872.1 hypothetical protein TWF132_001338 [Orbilia oligospora]